MHLLNRSEILYSSVAIATNYKNKKIYLQRPEDKQDEKSFGSVCGDDVFACGG